MTDDAYPVQAPGWTAIDRVLAQHYPGQTPHQFTSKTAYDLESQSPLPAISVFEADAPRHWHFVTYGLTELFEKTSNRSDLSGFGFELSFRLPRDEADSLPPAWALRMLQGLGHYVLAGHGELDSGHCIDLGGPLWPGGRTDLCGLVAVPDVDLGRIETPHGSVLFLQLFGLTADELEIVGTWDLQRIAGLVGDVSPRGVTDPARGSLREDRVKAPIFRRYELRVMI